MITAKYYPRFLFDAMLIIQVWRINGEQPTLIPDPEQTKLFSGDCYIVQYTYPGNGRDEHLFYAWLGRDSVLVSVENYDRLQRQGSTIGIIF